MIMHNGKQVGFIQHENNNIDKVMHNGNCVFEQGYPRDNNTITGDIVLDGTIGKSLKSWSITGNTIQDGTPSPNSPVEIQSVGERTKNLFDVDDCMTQYGQAIKNENGNWVFFSKVFHNSKFGMANGGYKIQPITGENVTFSATFRNVGSIATTIYLCIIGDDDNWTYVGSDTIDVGKTAKISISSVGCKAISFSYGSDNNWELISSQLEIGSSATSYEPYGYKIPVVTRGKNLFNYNDEHTTNMYTEKYTISNLDTNKYYTCSTSFERIAGVSVASIYFAGGVSESNGVWRDTPRTFKPDVNGKINVFIRHITADSAPSILDKVLSGEITVMVEEGSTATLYEPYIEPITTPIYLSEPLRKLGNYADTIEYIGNGQAKITRNIKSLTLTGTETWVFGSINDHGIYNFYNIPSLCLKYDYQAISNAFITQKTLHTDTTDVGVFFNIYFDSNNNKKSSLYLRVDDTIATDVDTLKSWLASKYEAGSPVIVEYVLDTPVEETIEVPNIPTFRNSPTIRGMMTSLSVDTTIKPSTTNVSFRSTNKYQRFISRYIDFDNNKMSTISGDFSNIRAFTNRRRCNVLDDGTISAFYGDDNYTEDGSNGQVMVYQPKFYYKVEPIRLEPITDSIGYHIREAIYSVSDIPLTGYKLHPAFINEAGNEVDYFCLSAYEGCAYDVSNSAYITNDSQTVDFTANTGDKLSSIANVKPMSGLTQQLTRPNAEIIAKNRGAGWHSYGIKQASANQMLMFIEYGNLQSNIGSGVTSITDNSSYNCSSYTGSTSSLGNTTGRASSTINEIGGTETTYTVNGKTSISYRGMENPYGNRWDFVYGINIHGDGTQRSGVPYICTDYNYAESKNSGNYVSAGFTTVNANGYIKAFGYGNTEYDWLFIGSDTGGTSGGIIGDYHYVTANLNGYRIALLGGFWHSGSGASGFCWTLHNGVGNRNRYIGARLCYIPQN